MARLKTLVLRQNRKLNTTKPIPLKEEEIQKEEYYEDLMKDISLNSTVELNKDHLTQEFNPSMTNANFLKRVRAHEYISKSKIERPLSVDDVVSEEKLPEFHGFWSVFSSIFAKRRPLKPNRETRTRRVRSFQTKFKIIQKKFAKFKYYFFIVLF